MSLIKRKLFVSAIIVVLIFGFSGIAGGFTLSGTAPAGEDEKFYLGDVNADGSINVGDAISILRHIVGLSPFDEDLEDEEALQRADVNLDGEVAVGDAIQVLRYIVGLTEEFALNDPAAVMTEKALQIVLESEVETVNLARDITLDEPLLIDRDITVNGECEEQEEKYSLSGEEVTVSANVDSFTAENTEIETLTLLGGGEDSVNLINAEVNMLNVNAVVAINIDADSKVNQANFNSPATVAGGNNIGSALIRPDLDVDADELFGEDKPGSIVSGISITMEPSDTTAGAVISPAPVVKLVDAAGDPVAAEGVTVKVSLSEGEFASDKVAVSTSADGVASFDGLTINSAGSYVLIFEAGGFDPVTSEEITVVPGPQISVAPAHGGNVHGYGWPSDTEITVTIEDDKGETVLTRDDITTNEQGNFEVWLEYLVDMKPGYIVTVSGEDLIIKHTVKYIEVTGFDVQNDKIFGKAGPGSTVVLVVHQDNGNYHELPRRIVTSDSEGEWEADFSETVGDGEELWQEPYSLQPEMYGSAEALDDNGNGTMTYWNILGNPVFEVFPREGTVGGFNWVGTKADDITVTIKNTEEVIIFEGNAEEFNPDSGWFTLKVNGQDIEPGYEVTVEDTGANKNSHIVTSLQITEFDRSTGVASGIANEGTVVVELVEPIGYGPPNLIASEQITVEEDGEWTVDFEGPIDENIQIYAYQEDAKGNKTADNFVS